MKGIKQECKLMVRFDDHEISNILEGNRQLAEKKSGKFGQGYYTIVHNLVALQHVLQVCIGHPGVYRGH